MKFFVPAFLASTIFVPAVLALPFSTARTNSIVAREVSAPSVFLVTREELEQLLFERGGAASSTKETLGLPLSEEDQRRLQEKEDKKLKKAQEKYRTRHAEVAAGGSHHQHAPEPTWAAGATGHYESHSSAAEKAVKDAWKSDSQNKAFTHAEIIGSTKNHDTGRVHTQVRFHNNDGSPYSGAHVSVMHDHRG